MRKKQGFHSRINSARSASKLIFAFRAVAWSLTSQGHTHCTGSFALAHHGASCPLSAAWLVAALENHDHPKCPKRGTSRR
jgi:hypothetical protein